MALPRTPYPVALIEFDGQAVYSYDLRSLDLETNVGYLADALTVVLDNSRLQSDFIRKEQAVEVWLGYAADPHLWDKSELVHVFSGAVDGVAPSFGTDRTLTVRCRDHTRLLIDSQADPGWSYASLADAGIVTLLARQAGLTPQVSPSLVTISEEEQQAFLGGGYPGNPEVGTSGWEIIQTLAVRNGFVSYVTPDKVLYWGPRGQGVAAVPIVGGVLDAASSLGVWTYLEAPYDLLAASFDDSALIVNKVTVVRWMGLDEVQPDGFVSGFAVDAGRIVAARGRVIDKTVASTTANSTQDCQAEARALLETLVRPAITAQATVEGDPRLVGDAKITLAGKALGRFAADYYIEAARHHFGTDGYACELQLSSVRPEASEVYRSALNVSQEDAENSAAQAAAAAGAQQLPVCGDGPPVDLTAEWKEFGDPVVPALMKANGIDASLASAACGPIAAAGMLKAYGIVTDPGKLAARGYKGGGPQDRWWTGGGMAAADGSAMVKLLESQGLKVQNLGAGAFQEVVKRASACIPVIANFPNHYMLLQAYRADARFFVGNTGSNALHGGSDWMSIAEMNQHPGNAGSVRTFIVADVPLPTRAASNQAVDPTGLPSMHANHASRQAMVDSLKPLAFAWEKQTGIPPEVFLAINLNESGPGAGDTLFGIKGAGAVFQTWESEAGTRVNQPASFRTYPDANAAYRDFVDLVTDPRGRYALAYSQLKAGGSGEQFVAGLQAAGYATDPDWAQKIASIMRDVRALL